MAGKGSVFISYSRVDAARARELEQQLSDRGFQVWRDESGLYGGVRWPKALGDAIAGSDVVLLLWSEPSSESHFVELEWCTALALRVPIVPVLLDASPFASSLASIHSLPGSQTSDELAVALERSIASSRLGLSRSRASSVMRELEAGGETEQLVERVRARADQMNAPTFRVLEVLRGMALPAAVASALGFGGTTFVLDDPFVLDRNLLRFVALLTIPSILLLSGAAVLRSWAWKGVALAAWLVIVGVVVAFAPRLIAGPVVDIDRPAIAVLLHRHDPRDPDAENVPRVLEKLPRTMQIEGNELSIEPLLYDVDPNKAYVRRAIRRNPFVRGVVRVSYRSQGDVRIDTEVPLLSEWRKYGLESIDTRRAAGPGGYAFDSSVGLKPGLGFAMNLAIGTSLLDHRLGSLTLGGGVISWRPRAHGDWSDDGTSTVATDAEELDGKILASVARVHGEFLSRVYGPFGADCDAMAKIDPSIAAMEGFEWLETEQEICRQSWPALLEAYQAGRFGATLRDWIGGRLAQTAIAEGLPPAERRVLAEGLSPDSRSLLLAARIFEQCGSTNFEPAAVGKKESVTLVGREDPLTPFEAPRDDAPDPREAAACLVEQLSLAEPIEGDALKALLLGRLATASMLGWIEDPSTLIERLGLDLEAYCVHEDSVFSTVVWNEVLSDDPVDSAKFDRARVSVCRGMEDAPAVVALAIMLFDDLDEVVVAVEHFDEGGSIDANGRRLLKRATDRLLSGRPDVAVYRTMVDEFVAAFNEQGWAAGVEALERGSSALEREDLSGWFEIIGEGSSGVVTGSALTGLRVLDELEATKHPIILLQVALLSKMFSAGPIRELWRVVDSRLASKLLSYEARAEDLRTYYPELTGIDAPALAGKLEDVDPEDQVDFLLTRLHRGGEPTILKAYLAEVYASLERREDAASTFSDLEASSTDPIRKDYYAMRANEMTGATCALGAHQPTRYEVSNYEELAAVAAEGLGVRKLRRSDYLAFLSTSEGFEDSRIDSGFQTRLAALYERLEPGVIERVRSQAPGFFLRAALVNIRGAPLAGVFEEELEFGCPELFADSAPST